MCVEISKSANSVLSMWWYLNILTIQFQTEQNMKRHLHNTYYSEENNRVDENQQLRLLLLAQFSLLLDIMFLIPFSLWVFFCVGGLSLDTKVKKVYLRSLLQVNVLKATFFNKLKKPLINSMPLHNLFFHLTERKATCCMNFVPVILVTRCKVIKAVKHHNLCSTAIWLALCGVCYWCWSWVKKTKYEMLCKGRTTYASFDHRNKL